MTRITRKNVDELADAITEAARKLELIDETHRYRAAGAYGGVRIECSFDWDALERVYGSDREAWPDGWSSVQTGTLGLGEGYLSTRETYERARGTLGALHAVIDALHAVIDAREERA